MEMTAAIRKVTIKGTKDGLVFVMDETCSFDGLLEELREKVESSHQKILTGPLIHVTVHLGSRYLNEEQQQLISDIIHTRGNLVIREFVCNVISKEQALLERLASQVHVEVRNVRSGQVLEHQGDLLLLGDVNPGGCVMAAGNIFVLGTLRGMAYAGKDGNEEAVIAASELRPTQLRIASVISRPPEEWMGKTAEMECAFLHNGEMAIEKINMLQRLRPQWSN